MKELLLSHAQPLAAGFFALIVVLLVLAWRHSKNTKHRSYSGASLVRPGNAMAQAGPPIGPGEWGAAAVPPPRHGAPETQPFSPNRASDLEARVLELEEALRAIQANTTQRFHALESRIKDLEDQLDARGSESGLVGSADTIPDALWNRDDRPIGGGPAVSLPIAEDSVISLPIGGDSVISQPIASGGGTGMGGLDLPVSGGVGVEIRGSEVVASQSYPPEAYLMVRGGGMASLVLNPEVPHNSFALDRFALFFELGERREGMYHTQTPAQVRWDGQRGTLSVAGKAVAR